MAVPRPRVVCPSCRTIHEQTGSTTVCGTCQRREEEREARQLDLGGRAGIRARGDFDAVFRDPRSPFARGFRGSFFRADPIFEDGMERFVERLRELYAGQIAEAHERAERRYEEGRQAGYAAGLAEGRRERDEHPEAA